MTFDQAWLADGWSETETLALAPTGVSDEFARRIFDTAAPIPPVISEKAWGAQPPNARQQEHRYPLWAQPYVGVRRAYQPRLAFNNERVDETVTLDWAGTFRAARGYTFDDPARAGRLNVDDQLRPWLTTMLAAGRDILTEYGAHGDLRLVYQLDLQSRGIWFESVPGGGSFDPERVLTVELDTTFGDDETRPVDHVLAELLRAVGHGPRDV